MTKVTARIKINNKHFSIHVDLDEALKVQKDQGDIMSAVDQPNIFSDIRKGEVASQKDLEAAFKTTDIYEIATHIIKKGEVQKTQEFRDSERDAKVKQVIQLLIKNSVDQHGRPYTEDRIKRALQEAHAHIDNRAPEKQLKEIVEKLQTVIPIKVEIRRIKIVIPAQYTGQVYGILKDYKEKEEWLANGSLEATLAIPAGMQLDFYDKLNGMTHGAVQSQELSD